MPDASYTGSPTGTGNPPGEHSKGYLKGGSDSGHFVSDGSYRGSMNVGVKASATEIGNQPEGAASQSLTKEANKESGI